MLYKGHRWCLIVVAVICVTSIVLVVVWVISGPITLISNILAYYSCSLVFNCRILDLLHAFVLFLNDSVQMKVKQLLVC